MPPAEVLRLRLTVDSAAERRAIRDVIGLGGWRLRLASPLIGLAGLILRCGFEADAKLSVRLSAAFDRRGVVRAEDVTPAEFVIFDETPIESVEFDRTRLT